jgi:L-serine dehydratase
VLLGLMDHEPDTVDVEAIPALLAQLRQSRSLPLPDGRSIAFDERGDLEFHRRETLPFHANGMRLAAYDASGAELANRVYYSVGGGFVVSDEVAADGSKQRRIAPDVTALPLPFSSGDDLLALTRQHGLTIAEVMRRNEQHWRSDAEIDAGLAAIWQTMQDCVARGMRTDGLLPGPFKVKRRAAPLYRALVASPEAALRDPLQVLDWVNLYALAVNEENAAGGRVVTAPTNGAAGIVPAVLHYYVKFVPGADDSGVVDFLLTAGAIGSLFKMNASISGAEVGCQGEVGSACAMAAAGLAEVMGGSPSQVENAAEIALEHNLGLTCDPIGGLVQVPCIERNAMAAMKAINAARLALRGDGTHLVSLDQAIATMRDTGRDMSDKYKETARGGLAVTFRTKAGAVPVAVNVVEC